MYWPGVTSVFNASGSRAAAVRMLKRAVSHIKEYIKWEETHNRESGFPITDDVLKAIEMLEAIQKYGVDIINDDEDRALNIIIGLS